ncbi:MAG: SusE domain-containing protein [Niabella sp.]
MNIKFIHLLSLSLILLICSGKKEENRVIYKGGTAPVLTSSTTGTVVLDKENKTANALTLSWTNPNYMLNTGLSSQNVTYLLQIDTAGKDFQSAKIQEMSIANNLGVTLTAQELNTFLSKMEFKAGVVQAVDIRVKSTLANESAPLISNFVTVTVNPYLDFAIEPPGTAAANYLDGNLWITGDAVASGWLNPLPSPYDVSQKFTRVDIMHYEATITFKGSGAYKLIQTQGVWGTQYHALDGSAAAALIGSFEKKDAEPGFPSPPAGTYKVQINFQTGKYTLTKQ